MALNIDPNYSQRSRSAAVGPSCVDGWLCQTHNFDRRQTAAPIQADRLSGPSRSLLSAPDIDLLEPRDGAAVAFPKNILENCDYCITISMPLQLGTIILQTESEYCICMWLVKFVKASVI